MSRAGRRGLRCFASWMPWRCALLPPRSVAVMYNGLIRFGKGEPGLSAGSHNIGGLLKRLRGGGAGGHPSGFPSWIHDRGTGEIIEAAAHGVSHNRSLPTVSRDRLARAVRIRPLWLTLHVRSFCINKAVACYPTPKMVSIFLKGGT